MEKEGYGGSKRDRKYRVGKKRKRVADWWVMRFKEPIGELQHENTKDPEKIEQEQNAPRKTSTTYDHDDHPSF